MVIDRIIILFIFLSLFYARLISRWIGMRFFFHFCILLLLLYSHFYYICSYFIVFYCFFNTRISINFRFSYTYCYEMHNPLVLLLTIFLYNHDIHGSCYFKILLSIIIWIFDAESFCFCTVQYTRVDWYFQNKVVNKIA